MDKKFPYGYDVNAYIDKAFVNIIYMKRLFLRTNAKILVLG